MPALRESAEAGGCRSCAWLSARNLPGSVGGQQEAEIPGAGSGRQHPAQVTDLSTGYGSSPLFPWLAHRGHKVCRSDLRCRAPRT